MQRAICIVDRGPMEKITVNVYAYEVPILQTMYGAGAVSVEELTETNERKSFLTEYQRLTKRYPRGESGMPLVKEVYGRPETRQLVEAMRKKYALEDFHIEDAEIGAGIKDEEIGEDDEPVTDQDLQPDFKLDTDGNRYLKNDEIKAGLDTLIGAYNLPEETYLYGAKDKREVLLGKLDAAVDAALEVMDVDVAENTTRDEKLKALEEAGDPAQKVA